MGTKMESLSNHLSLLLSCLLLLGSNIRIATSAIEERQTYIIHMDHSYKPSTFSTHGSWYRSKLASLSAFHDSMSTSDEDETLLYTYSHVIHGFSARLTLTQLSELEKMPGHIATYPESYAKLFTTHTPKYLGLTRKRGLWPAASYGNDVIIGIIDTGIWPESDSFNGRGMPPVPKRWKGECEVGTQFNSSHCNRRLIGARSFSKGLRAAGRNISAEFEYDSPRDSFGHGTHTASTAAGGFVSGAEYFGYAKGTAKGIAPAARVAMYKVLWASDTEESAATDVLAGMDQAIADGVDIMSLSLGFDHSPLYNDVIAVGALSAVEQGIFVACAAGNDGAVNSTYNGAPWIMTVGAGTIDRNFIARVTLGNGLTLEGTSYYPDSVYVGNVPLYYGNGCETLDPKEVADKVVFCDTSNKSDLYGQFTNVNRAGAMVGIFVSDIWSLDVDPEDYNIPSVVLGTAAAGPLRQYAMQTANSTVQEMKFKITKLGGKPAPEVASFSSRGPDPITPSVLKPDILAPGVDVLAAWVPNEPFTEDRSDYLVTDYALLSGTSMASPHVAGVAALLQAVHPEWSPAAIRSAIMTTAQTIDNTGSTIRDQWTGLPSTPLDFGAGHINPNKAMDPGLIYDMGFQDYVNFLCGLGYNRTQMSAAIRRGEWACPDSPPDLNYPSYIAIFSSNSLPMQKNFSRVVTNVGGGAAVYGAIVETPTGMRIQAEPNLLTFNSKNEKKEFRVSVEVEKEALKGARPVAYGYLKWVDQHMKYVVSSPVVAISL